MFYIKSYEDYSIKKNVLKNIEKYLVEVGVHLKFEINK